MTAAVRVIAASIVGFVLPGYLASVVLGGRARLGTAFIISLLVLFHAVLIVDAAGWPLTFAQVATWDCAGTAALAWWVYRRVGWWGGGLRSSPSPAEPGGTSLEQRALLGCVVAGGLVLVVRYLVQPLSGVDTPFRWGLLPSQMLSHERLSFYPPFRAEDYRVYFYPDGMPPLVPVAYWWLYAAAGRAVPALTVIVVLLEYACTVMFTLYAGAQLHSRRAGYLAAATLACSPLFYRAVFIGQETGLTALSMAAMLFFLTSDDASRRIAPAVSAGLAAALAALSREYGWSWVPLGVAVLSWRRARPAAMLAFVTTAVATAGPWYLRTWLRTGDPFYPLCPGWLFPVANPIYTRYIHLHGELLGLGAYSAAQWWELAWFLVRLAPIPLLVGPVVGVWRLRRWGFLTLAGVVAIAVWLQSIPYTEGITYSTRVLSPALVAFSLLAGLGAAERGRAAGGLVVVLSCVWMLVDAVAFPVELGTMPLADAFRMALRRQVYTFRESRLPALVQRILPSDTRILSDVAYAHAALVDSGYEVVPTWSPEVAFLFDPRVDPLDARRMLLARNIRAVLFSPQNPTGFFYRQHRFFAEDAAHWTVLAQTEMGSLVVGLPATDGTPPPS
jgi:hypothetical protein